MKELTERQLQLYRFIISFWKEHSLPPRLVEMEKALGTSTRAVIDILNSLEKKGYVSRENGIRVIRYVESKDDQLAPVFMIPLEDLLWKPPHSERVDTSGREIEHEPTGPVVSSPQTIVDTLHNDSATSPGMKAFWINVLSRTLNFSGSDGSKPLATGQTKIWMIFTVLLVMAKEAFGEMSDFTLIFLIFTVWLIVNIQNVIDSRSNQ